MTNRQADFDAIVVGAGFAGMYMLYRLRELGLSARVYEAGDDVGGTWFWNRYPGARCDVQSLEYSYQFSDELQQQWQWSERFSGQPEILAYAQHVAERFKLRPDIQFNTRVTAAHFNEASELWQVETSQGERVTARFCIMATGCLSTANLPDIKGLDSFTGACLHTGRWPREEVDFSAQRVAVIGTGSSAIQSIPVIASASAQLYVFQRTPNFSVPARNGPMDREYEQQVKADYSGFRARNATTVSALNLDANQVSALAVSEPERNDVFEQRWQRGGLPFLASFNDLGVNQQANDTAAEFLRSKIKNIVRDPAVAQALCPDTVVGCKRLCVDTDYYATFNRDNVTLVNVSETPIQRVTPRGILTDSQEYQVDMIVLATGFDAMTGALFNIDIQGRNGLTLKQKWAAGPRTYLGIGTAGFPNLFTITGPGSPSVLANMIVAIEQHVEWIAECINYLDHNGLATIEASRPAEDKWVEHVNEVASATLYTTGCNSWYLGANVPGKPRVFMPYMGFPAYVEKCNEVSGSGYRGFHLGSLST